MVVLADFDRGWDNHMSILCLPGRPGRPARTEGWEEKTSTYSQVDSSPRLTMKMESPDKGGKLFRVAIVSLLGTVRQIKKTVT